MNFAPYQDDSPDANRTLSPPPGQQRVQSPNTTSNRAASPRPNNGYQSYQDTTDRLPSPDNFDRNNGYQNIGGTGRGNDAEAQQNQRVFDADERDMGIFSTSLPMRLDFEACIAYLLLPPVGGALLLILEHQSDYIRFHAWQSSLLFTFLFVVHLIFSFSKVISIMLLILDIGLIAWLTMHAYRDAQTLDRWEVPFFGRMASGFVDDE